jgi:anti-sigma B factor antagonist
MKVEIKVLDNGIKQIILIGRLDIQGTGEVENTFTFQSAVEKAAILVDMSQVDFIASVGMRIFVSNAKALGRRGGKMVIFNPQPLVREVLEKVGINVLVPIYTDFDEACAALMAGVS